MLKPLLGLGRRRKVQRSARCTMSLEELRDLLAPAVAERPSGSAPGTAAGQTALGNNLFREGKYDQAIAAFETAMALDPARKSYATRRIADALDKKGMATSAMAKWNEALRYEPVDPWAHYEIGVRRFRAKDAPSARMHLAQALKAGPNEPSFVYYMGASYYLTNDCAAAYPHFKKYLEVGKDGAIRAYVVQWMRANGFEAQDYKNPLIGLFAQRRFAELEASMAGILQRDQVDEDGYLELEQAVISLAAYQGARDLAEAWRERMPQSSLAASVLGQAYIEWAGQARGSHYANTVTEECARLHRERLAMAEKILAPAVESSPHNAAAAASMMRVAKGLGWERPRAKALLDRALAANPKNYHLRLEYLQFLSPAWRGSEEEMLQFAQDQAKAGPKTSKASALIVDAHLALSMRASSRQAYLKRPEVWQAMRASFLESLSRFPKSRRTRSWLIKSAHLAGDFALAKEHLAILGEEKLDASVWGSDRALQAVLRELKAAPVSRSGASGI